jgi:pimeloyl-ACP methyl ester carboxylesterase
MTEVVTPIWGPTADARESSATWAAPRLARHQFELPDGHKVGVAVAGTGVPLVVVHGFSAEGFLYAQTLSRLVSLGFRVIAVDTAGHGSTQGLPTSGQSLADYSDLLGRILDDLGIRRYLLAGHSMGGRLATQLAADHPDRALGVILIDAIVGDTWDRMVYLFRVFPPLAALVALALAVDSVGVVPVLNDPEQAAKFMRVVMPTLRGHVLKPWRLLGPVMSILRSRSSRYALNILAEHEVPVFALHGDRDFAVPIRTAREAAQRAGGTLVEIEGAGHSWLLRDPESLPAIMLELLADGPLRRALDTVRLKPDGTERTDREIRRLCYTPQARILTLTPAQYGVATTGKHRRPKYRWTISNPVPEDELGLNGSVPPR